MYNKHTLVALVVLIPGFALGQTGTSYQCSFDGEQRRIEILTEPGVAVPCEVHYFKDTEMPGESQVLWTATTDASYCETKAEEFVAKLREWGWDCASGSGAKPAPETEAVPETEPDPIADDTEALEPAN